MARNNQIVLSDSERNQLENARAELFGTSEVPYGVVVEELVERVVED